MGGGRKKDTSFNQAGRPYLQEIKETKLKTLNEGFRFVGWLPIQSCLTPSCFRRGSDQEVGEEGDYS